MGRWQPGARGRLAEAALSLYRERGFEQTTVEEIAKQAGLTERTFFRHFSDKREVLFASFHLLEEQVRRTIVTAPRNVAPLDAVVTAFDALAPDFDESRDFACMRNAIIVANADLVERQRVKLASLASAIAEGLRQRGIAASEATLVSELAIAVFRVGFERWVDNGNTRTFSVVMRTAIDDLKHVALGEAVTPPSHR